MRRQLLQLAMAVVCVLLLGGAYSALAEVLPAARQPAAQPFLEGPKQVLKTPARQFTAKVLAVEPDATFPFVTLTLELLVAPRENTDFALRQGARFKARPFFALLGPAANAAPRLDPQSPESWLNLGAWFLAVGDRVRGELLDKTQAFYGLSYVERLPDTGKDKTP